MNLSAKQSMAWQTYPVITISFFLPAAFRAAFCCSRAVGKISIFRGALMVIRRLLGPAFDGEALTFKALASDSPHFGKADAHMTVASAIDSLRPL